MTTIRTPHGDRPYLSIALEPSDSGNHTLWAHGEGIDMVAIRISDAMLPEFKAMVAAYGGDE